MFYAKIRRHDIANGEGVRCSLFVSGCTFHCKGCFNPELQSFKYGKPYTEDTKKEIMDIISEPEVKGLSLLGGDPLCQERKGLEHILELVKLVKRKKKDVWIWSGYSWEEIFYDPPGERPIEVTLRRRIVSLSDVFVDGQFIEAQADRFLVWKGSANQRVIDVQASLAAGEIVEKKGRDRHERL